MAKVNINVKEITADIRNGLNEAVIMHKYGLTPGQFQRLLRKMMVAGHLSEMELFDWLRLSDSQLLAALGEKAHAVGELDTTKDARAVESEKPSDAPSVGKPANMSNGPAPSIKCIPVRLTVRDLGSSGWSGFVRDLSEKELRVAYPTIYTCAPGEVKNLCIEARDIGQKDDIRLEATCEWIKKRGRRGEYYVARFNITGISDRERDKVRSLIWQLLSDLQVPARRETHEPEPEVAVEHSTDALLLSNAQFQKTHELFLDGETASFGPNEPS